MSDQVKCPYCGESFSSRGINRHIEAKHPQEELMSKDERKKSADVVEEALGQQTEDAKLDAELDRTHAMDAQREKVENTDAIRLQHRLANKTCRHCAQSVWVVYKTRGELRYVRCKGCGQTAKVVVERNVLKLEEGPLPEEVQQI